jgi:hypothetical protein
MMLAMDMMDADDNGSDGDDDGDDHATVDVDNIENDAYIAETVGVTTLLIYFTMIITLMASVIKKNGYANLSHTFK